MPAFAKAVEEFYRDLGAHSQLLVGANSVGRAAQG